MLWERRIELRRMARSRSVNARGGSATGNTFS
jgi:hypothetical protein